MQTVKITCFTGIFVFLMSFFCVAAPITQTEKPTDDRATYAELLTKLDKDQMEEKLGRKLKFAERIMVKRLKKKINKKIAKGKSDEKPSGLALASLILGAVSIPFLFIPVIGIIGLFTAIAAIITGAIARDGSGSKTDKFGKIGFWLGIGALIFVVLLIITVLAFGLAIIAAR